ncbi:fibronectin type III domain-containing protein, partial [Chloroflexota bacterium]
MGKWFKVVTIVVLAVMLTSTVMICSSCGSDEIPPVISGVSASDISGASAVISWTTDEPATSQVEYGLTTGYGSTTILDEALVESHTVSLSGLTAGTTYHYRVKSKDAAGNEEASADYTFATTGVNFPDPNLEAAIREATGKTTGDITKADLEGLTELDATDDGITNLTGLQYCTNLTVLILAFNQITNFSPLENLTSLTQLWLNWNQ